MLRVYLDTNVYDHIDKGYIPAEEVEALRGALALGEIVAHLGVADVEELLGQWESDRSAAMRKLQLARDLVGFDGLLKPPAIMVEDAIRAYASGAPLAAPTLARHDRRFLGRELHRIAAGSQTMTRDVSGIVADVRSLKESFRDSMAEALARTLAEVKPDTYTDEQRGQLTFEAFWTRSAASWAEAFADRAGVAAACRERGLEGLLDVRAVRLAVGAAVSLVFSQVAERAEPHRGDGYDLWHASQASVADVFMTRDERFAKLITRVPMDGFRVVTSLPELLSELETTHSR